MIFRKSDYSETQEDSKIAEIIKSAKEFAMKIAPDDCKENIEKRFNDLTVFLCDGSRTFKSRKDGKLMDRKFNAAAIAFFENIDTNSYITESGIAVLPYASSHVITHEALHAFSSETGKTENGGKYIKIGSKYMECDSKEKVIKSHNEDLNEAITDALASRKHNIIGPNNGASYASQLIMADLLIGEDVKDNFFIQDVYFRKGGRFAEDFDRTIKASKTKFSDYLQGFKVIGNEEDCKKSDEMLKGAIEYRLRKAQTPAEIDKVYAFQQRVINLYKNGGIITQFMETEDIERMDSLLKFADKMQKQCKSNLVAQKLAKQQIVKSC